MLKRIRNSLSFRLKMARFGVFYLTSKTFSLKSIRLSGKRISLSFPSDEDAVHHHELGKILFQDCYRLGKVPGKVDSILDIGANVGIFCLAARHFYPKAVIHAYEPNRSLEPYLRAHCDPLAIAVHGTAVGTEAGSVSLVFRENSLHSVVGAGALGPVPQDAFRQTIERLGGHVDILKLDCEGAEWSLFEDVQSWKRVRYLTMEYHLWARPGSTVDDVRGKLNRLGFECVAVEPSPNGAFGLLQARNLAMAH
jgi:FkbM family methyltransferase